MKCIVLFGAGKSSSALIQYLKVTSLQHHWQVFVADHDYNNAAQKTGDHPFVKPVQVDVFNNEQRASLLQKADVVISLLPPSFHILVAKDCVQFKKHLLTASYIDEHIKALEKDIQARGLLFLCEMGLDPGIDHMSAMQLIHCIQEKGGVVTSFKSHCGGLVAPESDDNPWHYKISWNPRNVVMAGKAGAVYKQDNNVITKNYEHLFTHNQLVDIPSLGSYAWYPNRDSLSYVKKYGLENAETFIRTTLRHPEFCFGWKNIIDLQLTDESVFYDTNHLSIAGFFKEYFSKINSAAVKNDNLKMMISLINNKSKSLVDNADLLLQQLLSLGLEDESTFINKGICSVADILQFILETKLPLQPHDKDMVVMLHEIEYSINNQTEKKCSCLVVKGDNNIETAMAKTVGLPLGIATKLLLEGKLSETGLHIPINPFIYNPVLKELALHGIVFNEF